MQEKINKTQEIIKNISETSSTNQKIEILKSVLNLDEDFQSFFKEILSLAYNPQKRFHLKPFSYDNKFNELINKTENPYKNIFDLLNDLNKRVITGDEARLKYLNYIKNSNNQNEIDILNNILDKDLKAGFSSSTINKVFKNLIPEVPYMRCSLLDSITDASGWINGDYVISQEKLDGMFININLDDDGSVELLSRAGSIFTNDSNAFTDIINLISKTFTRSHQYHGELLMIDKETGEYLPREISNGLFNAILKNADKNCFDSNKYIVSVSLWDKIPFELINEEKPEKSIHNMPYEKRLSSLNNNIVASEEFINMYNLDIEYDILKIVDTRKYKNIIEAEKHFKQMLSEGKEGTIVKLPTMLWRDGTSKNQIKLKNKFEIELEVKEFLPGTGKNEQFFGSIRCESSDGLLSVNVSVSGFKDDEKKEISENRENYIGKILTVSANSIMYSKKDNKQHSLFLPVQAGFREDKKIADNMERIESQFENSINIKQKMEEIIKKINQKKNKSNKMKI